ncbi:uroporphyrinogen-III synthase [Heyndrickxia sporothermodurans]|uniref:uroporphyrinogen-III synthase n=1 Tax=Heyndrickxia sporothermodurans TaxID=46224 RepID=UPI002E1C4CBC|nr:uroporphyrinogen-III synthase [Heyndrickxia sporothermodurans]
MIEHLPLDGKQKRLPLLGKHVLVTRGGEKGKKLAGEIINLGGVSYVTPLIDFQENDDSKAQTYVEKLHEYEWIIFTSQNGVDYFFNELKKLKAICKFDSLTNRIAAVGSKTKEAIEKYNIEVEFFPKQFSATDFIAEFIKEKEVAGPVLLPKGNLASKTIAKGLEEKRIHVDEWIVYQTFLPPESIDKLVTIVNENELDYAMFTSPSSFHHFMNIVKDYSLQNKIQKIEFVTIGDVTKKAVEEYGYKVVASPAIYTIDCMLESLCKLQIVKEEQK